ncbi:MAG: bifunctional methylenetetrahydrofolate dehydrogenase/methenyltetrahydrofolate cyclohydrolase FolD [Pelagibacteraceae bacterium TMED267]|nr:MAG: bifunctional methylenetetrahydrofolate dehydrogenase/methenyltetrahydrofolate cyclohydrolase FolD [Pelagibacteraceae bacterium TMED267]|tara:strand:+ start:1648 stop:2544 length:897 start_codon:yes stop_codon:yes gene_type:complete
MNIIDGKAFSERIREKVKSHVDNLKTNHDIVPGLAVVLVGEDPASKVYVKNKGIQTKEAGMNSYEYKLEETVDEKTLLELVKKLNDDPNVHGILCQLPLPKHLNEDMIINTIKPAKDVDGFHISNVGLLNTGQKSLVPCTPLGCLMLLREFVGNLEGKKATVIGRSNIVGKPMFNLLLSENCTVTVVHSKTKNIEEICKTSDIIVAAVGRPNFVKSSWIKQGAVIIDVGINRVTIEENGETKSKLIGDVDFENCSKIANAITPVPGGVGPMTIACLLANTLVACCRSNNLKEPEELIL